MERDITLVDRKSAGQFAMKIRIPGCIKKHDGTKRPLYLYRRSTS